MSPDPDEHRGIAGTLAAKFINSPLTPLLILGSVLLGIFATLKLPREEEPQIKVPMIDVMVQMPGASAKEIETRVTNPMEKLLWEIPGVEYIYSTSSPGSSLVIVRYKVGTDAETALTRLNHKLEANFDVIPPGVSRPLIKPRGIDDVPILALTLHSRSADSITLRRLAAEVEHRIKRVPQVAETILIGGEQRQIRIDLDPAKLAARSLTPAGILPVLQQANRQFRSGEITASDEVLLIESGGFLHSPEEVGDTVLGAYDGRPVYLRDVATIHDGAGDPEAYVLHTAGGSEQFEPAVTITVAKRPGANAITVADKVLEQVERLKGHIIPDDVEVTITRHYGQTAAEKSNELLLHMGIAVVSVSLLILFALGKRESLVVALAIPSTLALTLLVFLLAGYTLNRITLFALIFSIGILVDDAIVVVENIVRHMRLPDRGGKSIGQIAIEAVSEVGNPTILATWAVIAAILPMAFVGGLMGPYMRPIPVGASAAMVFSLLVAFIVTPWAAIRILKPHAPLAAGADPHGEEGLPTRLYRRFMHGMLETAPRRFAFLGTIALLFIGACALVPIGWVQVKMLPFDNKSEFQVVINMPEGTALETTARAATEMAARLGREPEVVNTQVYAGTAAPFNFNGLVRHYFMRRGPNVADVQVNLLPKHDRKAASHDIAKRVRPALHEIAGRYGARIAVAEVPPGPPVLQTLVAECYGERRSDREKLARKVRGIFAETPDVVDIDYYWEEDQTLWRFVIDKEKAALSGISAATISETLRTAVGGSAVDLIHLPDEKEPVEVVLRLERPDRTDPRQLLGLRVRAGDANQLPEQVPGEAPPLIPLGELVTLERDVIDKSIYHKNLMPVTYVIADVAGEAESPVYAIGEMNDKIAALDPAEFGGRDTAIRVHNLAMPESDIEPSIKWDGEWHITLEVFRDLGIAFGACLILIYMLMVGWFRSFITPMIVMVAIPFSLIGILPAHGAMGAFFTATSMIGFMAGGGIVVRNSIILVDFIQLRLREGMPLLEAVVDAGAVRFRPMALTAMAVVVGAAVILTDPIFQGLALSLMAGEVASLFVSRLAVPVLYYIVNARRAAVPTPEA
ncbi:efflux RND transporter permease subunit [Haloferula sp. A504]|uniref:efflux RND transporter permease subunit n=1 Tax=Haloferula sp. A504 TaxID=3373601 RepID=UPI0031CA1AB1|nr:efflux RND transporter permease subunit [Verrucomicrobiaceae bacterium E54]